MNNRYGVDVWYFRRELERLSRDISNYTPAELERYFLSLSRVANG